MAYQFSWMFAPTPSRRRVEGVYHSVVDSRAGKIQMIPTKPSSRGRRRPCRKLDAIEQTYTHVIVRWTLFMKMA